VTGLNVEPVHDAGEVGEVVVIEGVAEPALYAASPNASGLQTSAHPLGYRSLI
jgi:hypothetical protein